MSGYKKIVGCCEQASADGYEWVWIDTCCIDKRSSAELSEAINSMYRWYWQAAVCYAHLQDVDSMHIDNPSFRESKWFRRGWTLQELLAPEVVEFYTKNWVRIGTRATLITSIEAASRIERKYLEDRHTVQDACIATKFSWASRRQTTRTEDMAYCLLGLVNINMPMLYGEGDRAFYRLQLEILRQTHEQTIFAWGLNGTTRISSIGHPFLASSPRGFENSARVRAVRESSAYTMIHDITNIGLRISFPVMLQNQKAFALFRCQDEHGNMLSVELEGAESERIYTRHSAAFVDRNNSSVTKAVMKEAFLVIQNKHIDEQPGSTEMIRVVQLHDYCDYRVSGIMKSTQRSLVYLQGKEEEDPILDLATFMLGGFGCLENEIACIRMTSKTSYPRHIDVGFKLLNGRPVLYVPETAEQACDKEWTQRFEKWTSQTANVNSECVRATYGAKGKRTVLEVRARKLMLQGRLTWTLSIRAFPCACHTVRTQGDSLHKLYRNVQDRVYDNEHDSDGTVKDSGEDNDARYQCWFNAPPKREQHERDLDCTCEPEEERASYARVSKSIGG